MSLFLTPVWLFRTIILLFKTGNIIVFNPNFAVQKRKITDFYFRVVVKNSNEAEEMTSFLKDVISDEPIK